MGDNTQTLIGNAAKGHVVYFRTAQEAVKKSLLYDLIFFSLSFLTYYICLGVYSGTLKFWTVMNVNSYVELGAIVMVIWGLFHYCTFTKFASKSKLTCYSCLYQLVRIVFYFILFVNVTYLFKVLISAFTGAVSLSIWHLVGSILYLVRGLIVTFAAFIGILIGHPLFFGTRKMDKGGVSV